MRYPSWKTAAALLILTACSSDSTAPPGLPTLYSISVSLATTTLPVGQSTQAFATLKDSIGRSITVTGDTVTWASSNPAVASIAPTTGTVTALTVGTTTISAATKGKIATVDLSVTAPSPGVVAVAALGVNLDAPRLNVGRTTQATAIPKDSAGNVLTGRQASWNTSDQSIATVSTAGVVTGLGAGTAAISATIDGMTGTASVTVMAPSLVADLKLKLNAATIQVGIVAQGTVTARDTAGDVVSGLPATWSSSDPSVATVSPTGAVTGVALGTVTISVTVDGKTAESTLTVGPKAVTTVTLVVAPQLLMGDTMTVLAILGDADNNQLSDRVVTWTVNNPTIASISETSGFMTGLAVGAVIVTGSSEGQTGNALVRIIAGSSGGGGGGGGGGGAPPAGGGGGAPPAGGGGGGTPTTPTASLLSIATQPSASVKSGVTLAQQPSIQVRDASSNAFSQAGIAVSVAIASGSGTLSGTTTATTNSSGVATFSNLVITGPVGARTLSFSSAGLSGAVSGTINVTAGSATQLSISSQPSAGAQSAVAFTTQPSVQLRDASGNVVGQAGVVVTASVATGSGTLGGTATATTNSSGIANFSNLSITGTGSHTLRFSATGFTSATSSTVTLGAGAPTKLTITTQPSTTAGSGVAFGQQPVVQLRDASNNVVNQAGVVVTATIVSGGGSLNGTTTATTNSSGVASFTNLAITGVAGARTLSFDASSLSGATSGTITVSAGTASQLVIAAQPSTTAQSGVAFTTQPQVRLQDALGNLVSQAGVVVTASVATGSGTLAGTLTATTNSSGVATFTNLRITGSGAHTLHFVAAGLLAVNCGTITVSAPAATQLAIATQPSASTASGTAFSQQPSIQLRDASNNVVGQSGVTITVAIATGGGTLGGTTTASTNASGVATFSNLSISGTAGSRTLTFTSGSLSAATSSAIAVSAAATPTQLGLTVQAVAGQSGVTLAPGFVVQLMDASGAAVAQSGVIITATQVSGTATLGGTIAASTGATGAANFSNLSFTGSGTQTVKFSTSTGLTVTSGAISITAAGGFTTPNILSNASFETGWNGFTDWTGAAAPSGVTRDNTTTAPDGSWSIKRTWTPNPTQDGGSQLLYHFANPAGGGAVGGGYDRVWLRFSFKLTAPITTIMKFARYYNDAFNVNLGGLFIQNGSNIVGWGWDQENSAIVTKIGLSEAQVIDGNWHTIEVDYWRNGDPSGQPSVAFLFDGASTGFPDGTTNVQYAGAGNSSYWKGGRLYAGTRSSTVQLGYQEWLATLNAGNTTTGQLNIDRVSYSTLGRIGN